jgi:ankyrin repeat protein
MKKSIIIIFFIISSLCLYSSVFYDKLIAAIQDNNINEVKKIIKNGGNINENIQDTMPPFLVACDKGNIEIVKFLIEKGSNVTIKIKNKNDTNINNLNAIFLLAFPQSEYSKNIEIAKYIIENGVDVNSDNGKGITALMIWSRGDISSNKNNKGYLEIVNLLVKKGAEVNKKGNAGFTAMTYAVVAGQSDILKVLIENGGDINIKDNQGRSLLINFAINKISEDDKNIEIAQQLIKSGININEKENDGKSALYYANLKFKDNLAKVLINSGAKE